MTDPAPNRLDEVQRLTSALADQVLDAQITGRSVSGQQAVALAQAANLLHDHGVEWPPMLEQALHGLAKGADHSSVHAEKRTVADDEPNSVIAGLERFMGAFRRERRQS